jgi:UDP:flavonoid glycosyltransferase YjiC (YdhE family)
MRSRTSRVSQNGGIMTGMRALVVTWSPGGNLPPLLAAASALRGRGHDVVVLASGETRGPAQALALAVTGYTRTPDPDVHLAFEAQATEMMATAAGLGVALDVRDAVADHEPAAVVVDCMLPGAIAGARAMGVPVASLVHFLYGAARRQMRRSGGAWTTDLDTLTATHGRLGLPAPRDGIDAWEAPELVLVTAPRWFDVEAGAPEHVVHAGPLGVHTGTSARGSRVLLTFSTTVMDGQPDLIERACVAVSGLDAVLTLGPAVSRDAVRAPGIEVRASGDHDRLMPDCAAVVSHGGLGTVLRALAHGVPQVVLPLGRDQTFNAGRVEQLGAGLQLAADAPPEHIRTALDLLLAEPRFRAATTAAAERIAAAEPDRSAAEVLQRLRRFR